MLILIPIYWKLWGTANFLWFSGISLFVNAALWLESSLRASMVAVGVLIPELFLEPETAGTAADWP